MNRENDLIMCLNIMRNAVMEDDFDSLRSYLEDFNNLFCEVTQGRDW